MSHVAVNHSLQSKTYWINGQRFDQMDARHISNSLRLIVKNPLHQLRAAHDAHLRDSCMVPDDVHVDERLPDGGQEIFAELVKRWQWNEAQEVATGDGVEDEPQWFKTRLSAIKHLCDHIEPATFDQLKQRSDEWVRRQPTYLAMREVLVDKIINGMADVVDRTTLVKDFG